MPGLQPHLTPPRTGCLWPPARGTKEPWLPSVATCHTLPACSAHAPRAAREAVFLKHRVDPSIAQSPPRHSLSSGRGLLLGSTPLRPERRHTRPGLQGRMGTSMPAQSPKSLPPKGQPGLGKSSPERCFYTHQGRDRQCGEQTPPGKYTQVAAHPFYPHETWSHETCYGDNKTGKEAGQEDRSLGDWAVPWPQQEGPDTVTTTHKPDTGICFISCLNSFAPQLSPHPHAPGFTTAPITATIVPITPSPCSHHQYPYHISLPPLPHHHHLTTTASHHHILPAMPSPYMAPNIPINISLSTIYHHPIPTTTHSAL